MSFPVPGPRSGALSAYRFARDPYAFLLACKRRYGDPFSFPLGGKQLTLTGEPELARQVFAADPDTLGAFNPGNLSAILGANSVILLSGERHRRERKLLAPPFHGARMRSYGAIIRESALRRGGAWRVGEPFDVQRTAQEISIDVIVRAVFGIEDPARVALFSRAMVEVLAAIHPILIFARVLQRDLGPLTPWRRLVAARRAADVLIQAEIDARRRQPGGDDILSLMLSARDEDGQGMRDEELHDELLTLLFAGHETTAIAISWAFYWLLRHPPALARLREELAGLGPDPDPEAVAAAPWLEAVCHETLRLWPILPMVPRTLVKPMRLGPHELPRGASVGVATALLHAHPELYPEPERFKPERFLARKYSPFEFTPFGGGNRRCIGAAFALYEMKQALAALVPLCELRLVRDAPLRPRRRNLTLGPRGGVEVVRVR